MVEAPLAKEKFAQSVSRSQTVGYGVFAGSDQIPRRFLFARRDADFRQLAGAIEPRQFFRIAPVSFHPVTGSDRRQRRRDDHGPAPETMQLPLYLVSARSRLVDKHRSPGSQSCRQARNRFATIFNRHHFDGSRLARRQNRHREVLFMNVHPNHCAILIHEPAPPYVDRPPSWGQPTYYAGCRLVHPI
jgi:hypothetical protein